MTKLNTAEPVDSGWQGVSAITNSFRVGTQDPVDHWSQPTCRHYRPCAWQQTHWGPVRSARSAYLSWMCSSLGTNCPVQGYQAADCLKEASYYTRPTSSHSAGCWPTSTLPFHCSAMCQRLGGHQGLLVRMPHLQTRPALFPTQPKSPFRGI